MPHEGAPSSWAMMLDGTGDEDCGDPVCDVCGEPFCGEFCFSRRVDDARVIIEALSDTGTCSFTADDNSEAMFDSSSTISSD
mmetsp:Transcript_73986/g.102807  ORF Transcript_73986/g.102807 Transcript_73986/m.102807 type:complete len:82 (+) Transcript_73986:390-635(+)